MKDTRRNILLWITGNIILVALITMLFLQKKERQHTSTDKYKPSVTFILGEDKPGSNYFDLARQFFSLDSVQKSDKVITSCRTIACVIEHLNGLEKGQWSSVNIVAHGNPSTGLNLYLDHNGHKATPKRLLQECMLPTLPTIHESVVDSNTNITFYSCGIGNNMMMNLSLKKIFATTMQNSPNIALSKQFIVFAERADTACPAMIKANYYSYFYKRAKRPSDSEIIQSLKSEYGAESIDWNLALTQDQYQENQSIFTNEYHLPISYTRIYSSKGDRPAFHSWKDKKQWILEQPEIIEKLDEIDIPFEKFNWQVHKIIHTDENGHKVPAIKAIGMTTVLNVLSEV